MGWRHAPTDSRAPDRPPGLVLLGLYVRRARYFVDKSQQTLSDESGVSQSMISRLERALAAAMRVDKLVDLGEALGPLFPLGFCPHKHRCAWQPLGQDVNEPTQRDRLNEFLVGTDLEVPAKARFLLGDD